MAGGDVNTFPPLERHHLGFEGNDTLLYGYVLSEPVNGLDPDGTIRKGIMWGLLFRKIIKAGIIAAAAAGLQDYMCPGEIISSMASAGSGAGAGEFFSHRTIAKKLGLTSSIRIGAAATLVGAIVGCLVAGFGG